MRFFMKQCRSLLLSAALAVGTVCWFGCGDDSDDPWGGDGLVCAKDEGWIIGGHSGFAFYSDKTWLHLYKESGDGKWYWSGHGTYTTSGNTINTVDGDGDKATLTYSVSGNELTLTVEGHSLGVYTKTKGINPVGPAR